MESDIIKERADVFAKACKKRFDDSDVDWKKTFKKDKATGNLIEGRPLAYLNWAVAWRSMVEFYPDAEYKVLENADGGPLFNVNGYGMVKVAVKALGVERIEIFPIMRGGQNNSVKMGEIDGRDINDAIQRALTKCIARFGVGLYIYEGKLDKGPKKSNPAQFDDEDEYDSEPPMGGSPAPLKTESPKDDSPTASQLAFAKSLMLSKNISEGDLQQVGANPNPKTRKEASALIDFLRAAPTKAKPKEEHNPDDDLPF